MNKRRQALGSLVGLALGGAVARPRAGSSRGASPAADRDRIRELLEAFSRAWNAGDVASLAAVYGDPHLDLNEPRPLQTRAETARRLGLFHAARVSRIEIRSDEVVILGDWALQRGEFVLTHRLRGERAASVERRRYLEVLRREGDGAWRVHWAIDGPLAQAP